MCHDLDHKPEPMILDPMQHQICASESVVSVAFGTLPPSPSRLIAFSLMMIQIS